MFEWTLISFYTPLYEPLAMRLRSSCEKWKVPHYIVPLDSEATWEENCSLKSRFVLETLEKFKSPLLWVDADAELIQPPPTHFPHEFATVIHAELPEDHPSKVVSCVIYVTHTPHTLSLLKKWIERCDAYGGKEWDQISLKEALLGENIPSLPKEFSMIYDRLEEGDEPIILHYQASRLYKKIINGEVAPFLTLLSKSEEDQDNLKLEF
ncbi:MAG: hypothetical protein KBC64_03105 [Simkaniaceae bacterium]|nr:hypothetical protein [Simkaniaceae bacterium]